MVGTVEDDEIQYVLGKRRQDTLHSTRLRRVKRSGYLASQRVVDETRGAHPNFYTGNPSIDDRRDQAYRTLTTVLGQESSLRPLLFDHLGFDSDGAVLLDEVAKQPPAAHYVVGVLAKQFNCDKHRVPSDYKPTPEVVKAATNLAERVHEGYQAMLRR